LLDSDKDAPLTLVTHFPCQNDQRQRRRDEVAAGEKWQLKYFEHIEEDPMCKPFASCADFVVLTACLRDSYILDTNLSKLYKAAVEKQDAYIRKQAS
jgi:hypothetical protein